MLKDSLDFLHDSPNAGFMVALPMLAILWLMFAFGKLLFIYYILGFAQAEKILVKERQQAIGAFSESTKHHQDFHNTK